MLICYIKPFSSSKDIQNIILIKPITILVIQLTQPITLLSEKLFVGLIQFYFN